MKAKEKVTQLINLLNLKDFFSSLNMNVVLRLCPNLTFSATLSVLSFGLKSPM